MNTHLSSTNTHPRDERIAFEESTHTYTIDGVADYTSVTSWVHTHFNGFNADAIIDKMMLGRGWASSKYFGMTKQAIKDQWTENGNLASAAGTAMHYDIECFYNFVPTSNNSIEFTYFKQFCTDFPNLIPFRTEWTVFDKETKLAGSIDMVFTDKAKNFYICDWKRSKQIKTTNRFEHSNNPLIIDMADCNFNHYVLQLNTYRYILEKNYDIKIKYLFIICLHPNNPNGSYIKIDINGIQDTIKQLLEFKLNPPDKKDLVDITKLAKLNAKLNKLNKKRDNIDSDIIDTANSIAALNKPAL